LSACGGGETVGEALGYELTGPDEMAVIKRPPLTVPPDFNLRPPRSGEDVALAKDASSTARRTLLGSAASEAGEPTSEGQNILISRSDRTELDLDKLTETRAENRVDGALLRRLLAWNPNDDQDAAEGENGEAVSPSGVEVVSRSQTVIDTTSDANADADTDNAE
jgi:hypothetical protein